MAKRGDWVIVAEALNYASNIFAKGEILEVVSAFRNQFGSYYKLRNGNNLYTVDANDPNLNLEIYNAPNEEVKVKIDFGGKGSHIYYLAPDGGDIVRGVIESLPDKYKTSPF